MDKIIVNKYFITEILAFISYHELDEIEDLYFRLNNENDIKIIIRYILYVNYFFKPKEFKIIFKNTLKYFLNVDINYEELYYEEMPSLSLPSKGKNFFIWMWEVFYENEDYYINHKDIKSYILTNDKKHLNNNNSQYKITWKTK